MANPGRAELIRLNRHGSLKKSDRVFDAAGTFLTESHAAAEEELISLGIDTLHRTLRSQLGTVLPVAVEAVPW